MNDGKQPKASIQPALLSKEELRKVALDFVTDKIFTDRHVRKEDGVNMLRSIFMPIGLAGLGHMDIETIGMIYEDIERAGPRSVNGYPIFMSYKMIHRQQMDDLGRMVMELETALDSAAR